MRVLIRTSRLAIWSQRLAGFALPVSIIPVWMHREQLLDSQSFQILLALAALFAFMAVLFGLAAYFRLWHTGDRGWGKSSMGIFLGLLCLSPLIYGAGLALRYPLANDVSTDTASPPRMLARVQTAIRTPMSADEIAAFFPGISPRQYDIAPPALFELVQDLVRRNGWDIRVSRRPGLDGAGTINAMASTFMGWRDEVAIRLLPTLDGSRLDMRSASLNGAHDLGANGNRIERFLAALDEEVAGLKEAEVDHDDSAGSQPADGGEGRTGGAEGG